MYRPGPGQPTYETYYAVQGKTIRITDQIQTLCLLTSINLISKISKRQPTALGHSFVKADLHGAILSHATSLRRAYDTKKSRRILKHVLKPYDNRGLKGAVSVS